jgi:hypothetical protein
MNDDTILLRCSHCGHHIALPRESDPDLPRAVTEIVTNECDKCEAANGGFGEERWYDADGNEVHPE